MNCMFLLYFLLVQDNNLLAYNIMGGQILKWKCACGNKLFCYNNWKLLSLKMIRALHQE